LQRENNAQRQLIKELQDQLKERITIEDFLSEVQKTPHNDGLGTPPDSGIANNPPQSPQVSQTDIKSLVEQHLQEQRMKEQIQANVTVIKQELTKAWGPNYHGKLVEKSKELGVDQAFLESVAAKSPKAFLNLVLDKDTLRSDPNIDMPIRTSINSGINTQDNTVRDQKYWDKIKKQDPKAYYSEKMTIQRHKDAQRLGVDFFN